MRIVQRDLPQFSSTTLAVRKLWQNYSMLVVENAKKWDKAMYYYYSSYVPVVITTPLPLASDLRLWRMGIKSVRPRQSAAYSWLANIVAIRPIRRGTIIGSCRILFFRFRRWAVMATLAGGLCRATLHAVAAVTWIMIISVNKTSPTDQWCFKTIFFFPFEDMRCAMRESSHRIQPGSKLHLSASARALQDLAWPSKRLPTNV